MVFEMAVQLQERGDSVELLAMVDTACPSYQIGNNTVHVPVKEEFEDGVVGRTPAQVAAQRVGMQHIEARKQYLLHKQFIGQIVFFYCLASFSKPGQDGRRLWRKFATEGVRYELLAGYHGQYHNQPQLSHLSQGMNAWLSQGPVTQGFSPRNLFCSFRIKRQGEQEYLLPWRQQAVPIIPSIIACIYRPHFERNQISISGWVEGPDGVDNSLCVIVFLNDRFVGRAGCSCRNLDEEILNRLPEVAHTGFSFELPMTGFKRRDSNNILDLYVWSIRHNKAWKLKHLVFGVRKQR